MPTPVNGKWNIVNGTKKSIHHSPLTINIKVKQGFTLIELLVVISIIAILVAAATVSWTNAQVKARDGRRKSDLKSIQQAIELHFQEYGTYPDSDNGRIKCTPPGSNIIVWGSQLDCNGKTFINPLPKDPKWDSTLDYYYESVASATSANVFLKYQISASLENSSDQEYCTPGGPSCEAQGKLPCEPHLGGVLPGYTYCVIQP